MGAPAPTLQQEAESTENVVAAEQTPAPNPEPVAGETTEG